MAKRKAWQDLVESLPKVNRGYLYKLDIPDEDIPKYLDWDKPLSEQPEHIQRFYKTGDGKWSVDPSTTGGQAYQRGRVNWLGTDAKLSKLMADNGILGIRYLDGSSRSAGEGTYNYVTFDPSRIKVLERK